MDWKTFIEPAAKALMLFGVCWVYDCRVILPAHLVEEESHDVCAMYGGNDGQLRRQRSEMFSTRGAIRLGACRDRSDRRIVVHQL